MMCTRMELAAFFGRVVAQEDDGKSLVTKIDATIDANLKHLGFTKEYRWHSECGTPFAHGKYARASLAPIENLENRDNMLFDLYRNTAIKSFELSLETASKLLRIALKAYSGNPREVDKWVFNNVLRHAGKHSLMYAPAVSTLTPKIMTI